MYHMYSTLYVITSPCIARSNMQIKIRSIQAYFLGCFGQENKYFLLWQMIKSNRYDLHKLVRSSAFLRMLLSLFCSYQLRHDSHAMLFSIESFIFSLQYLQLTPKRLCRRSSWSNLSLHLYQEFQNKLSRVTLRWSLPPALLVLICK